MDDARLHALLSEVENMTFRTLSDAELAYVVQQYLNMTAKDIAAHLTTERGEDAPPVSEGQVFSAIKRLRKHLQAQLVELERLQQDGNDDDRELTALRAALARLAPHQKAVQRQAQLRSLVQEVLGEGSPPLAVQGADMAPGGACNRLG